MARQGKAMGIIRRSRRGRGGKGGRRRRGRKWCEGMAVMKDGDGDGWMDGWMDWQTNGE